MPQRKSAKAQNANGCGVVGTFLFCSIFFFVGLGILWFLAIRPLLKVRQAMSWDEVGCVVRHIGVKVHHGDGDTYSPEVSYDYSYGGQPYTGDRFWFGSGSYSNRKAIADAIAPFQAGGEYPCYVNPKQPNDSVLTRQVASFAWLGWVFGGVFSGFGALAMYLSLYGTYLSNRSKRSQQTKDKTVFRNPIASMLSSQNKLTATSADGPRYDVDSSVCPLETEGPDEPIVLETVGSRVGTAIGAWIFSLFWNGISWTVGYFALQDFQWFGILFFIPFALIGIAMIGFAIYSTLQIWNPKTTIVCSQRNLYPGSDFEVSWLYQAGAARIFELTIELEGQESATYRQGTTTRTDKHSFFKQTLVQTSNSNEIQKGFRLVQLPADTMHTFESGRNSITWQLRAHGKIRYWPDVADTFTITIFPPPIEGDTDAAR